MKKNITINMFGTLYQIDEDAYELLKEYQDNMRSYYGKRDGGDEIADDVEHRIAELFDELVANGTQAITIEHVQHIINRIGNPQEMDGEESETPRTESVGQQEKGIKKLYRDPEDCMAAGVISGLCHYLGWEEVWLARLVFALLCIFSHSVLLWVYCLCWLIIPEAKTAEERLQMYGQPVNPNTLKEEVMKGINTVKAKVQDTQTDNAKGCLSTFLRIVLIGFALIGVLGLGGMVLGILIPASIGIIASLVGITVAAPFALIDPDLQILVDNIPSSLIWICVSAWIIVFIMPLFVLIHVLFRRKDSKPTSAWVKIILIIAWIIALAVGIGSLANIALVAERQFGPDMYIGQTLPQHTTVDEGVAAQSQQGQTFAWHEQAID